ELGFHIRFWKSYHNLKCSNSLFLLFLAYFFSSNQKKRPLVNESGSHGALSHIIDSHPHSYLLTFLFPSLNPCPDESNFVARSLSTSAACDPTHLASFSFFLSLSSLHFHILFLFFHFSISISFST